MQIKRILIAGLGSIGRRHLALSRKLFPNADIQVLRHRDCQNTPQHASGCLSRLDDAVAFAPNLAVIANPAPMHVNIAKTLANSGVHLLIEKPLSISTEYVPELLAICKANHVVLLVGYNLRFLPSLCQFRTLLHGDLIGRILSMSCEVGQYLPSWRPDTDYRRSVSARAALGGGALLELSHELDYVRWLFGDVNWVQACLTRQSQLEIDVEDVVHLILGFIPDSDGHQLVGTVSMDFIRHDSTRQCVAVGEKGTLRWNGLAGTVELFEPEAAGWKVLYSRPQPRDESYTAEWNHFLACISGDEQPLITGADGLAVLELIEAARKSSAIGRKISFHH